MTNVIKENVNEIIWNVVNSVLAGSLVFLGSVANGNISYEGVLTSIASGAVIAAIKFRQYWKDEKSEYTKIFSFI